jgi:F-type H+-transporting ATPase subunit delta
MNLRLIDNYSSVLFNIYKTQEEIFDECIKFKKVFSECCVLNDFFNNKDVCNKDKIEFIKKLKFIKYSNKFFIIVINNNRSEYIRFILDSFFKKYENFNKICNVKVVTCSKMDENSLKSIERFFSQKINSSKIIIENIIDNTLIGGFVAFVEGKKYNYSVKNNLQNILKYLTSKSECK